MNSDGPIKVIPETGDRQSGPINVFFTITLDSWLNRDFNSTVLQNYVKEYAEEQIREEQLR